jgi:tetratricopeptide (TPR) repeat protein
MLDNERPAGDRIRVRLVTGAGVPVTDSFTDRDGRVKFRVTFSGEFRLEVSGTPIVGTTVTNFRVEEMDKSKTVLVSVKPKVEGDTAASKAPAQTATSAAELHIPAEAHKAFEKGMEAWQHNDYTKAAEQFEKAVTLFPQYDSAFNNLGVMYFHMNQVEKARAAFEKSVALNDKNADADRNLARILINDGNFARAQELLHKSLMVEPLNTVTLTLMCVADIQAGDDDGALAMARKTHQLPHEGYSVVHFVAGQAYEHKGDAKAAYDEYQTYLQESPSGSESVQVRKALARLQAGTQASPQ